MDRGTGRPALGAVEEAWNGFHACVRQASLDVLASCDGDVEVVDALQFVASTARAAVDLMVLAGDRRRPRFERPIDATHKFLADNPDAVYDNAAISGRGRYLVTMPATPASYVGLVVMAGNRGGEGEVRAPVAITAEDLDHSPDGSLAIVLGGPGPTGDAPNWIGLDPTTSSVQIRQYLPRTPGDGRDLAVELPRPVIRSLDQADELGVTPDAVSRRLHAAASWVTWVVHATQESAEVARRAPNRFVQMDPAASSAMTGTPDNAYDLCWFDLRHDDALVVRGRAPSTATYWSFTAMDPWLCSFDHRDQRVWANRDTLGVADGGTYELTLSRRGQVGKNALTTSGRRRGVLMSRWLRASDATLPETSVVSLGALA